MDSSWLATTATSTRADEHALGDEIGGERVHVFRRELVRRGEGGDVERSVVRGVEQRMDERFQAFDAHRGGPWVAQFREEAAAIERTLTFTTGELLEE